jgi:hypothetical protein
MGRPSGAKFGYFGDNIPALNNAGQIAFRATLIGSGVDGTNGDGFWATDRTGALQLIAREDDLLEMAPGDFRTISSVVNDGRPISFNNLGQLAFWAGFTDGTSGIFVSNRVAFPEPSSLLLAASAAAGLFWRRRASREDIGRALPYSLADSGTESRS